MLGSKAGSPSSAPISTERRRSVFAEDLFVEGNIASEGILEFGGEIVGDLTADAVILTATARVKGRVRARQLTIEGTLQGAASALSINIKNGARVEANCAYDTLEVASGAHLDGQMTRVSAESFNL